MLLNIDINVFLVHALHNSCATLFARIAEIPHAVFVLDKNLACELEIENFSDTEGAIDNYGGGIR